MVEIRQFMIDIGSFLALNVNYVGAYVFAIIWGLDVVYYMLMITLSSFLFGATVKDLTKSTIIMSASLISSIAVAAGLLSAPSLVFGESETISLVLAIASRYLLMGFMPCIGGTLVGCIVGDFMEEL